MGSERVGSPEKCVVFSLNSVLTSKFLALQKTGSYREPILLLSSPSSTGNACFRRKIYKLNKVIDIVLVLLFNEFVMDKISK